MEKQLKQKTSFYLFSNLSKFKAITHFVSTRLGGYSMHPFASLNLGLSGKDSKEKVLANRELVANELQISLSSFVFPSQVHGNHVVVIDEKDKGKGAFGDGNAIENADAILTNVPNICLNVQAADCVPILLFDPKAKAVAAIHSGWKSTVKKIATCSLKKMQEVYGSKPENIIAGIGPSMAPTCYEVGKDVENAVIESFGTSEGFVENRNGKLFFDLWYANQKQLLDLGVRKENIEIAGICTHCNTHEFFSARKESVNSGRFAAGIFIKK